VPFSALAVVEELSGIKTNTRDYLDEKFVQYKYHEL
jgi:hypothetical protein